MISDLGNITSDHFTGNVGQLEPELLLHILSRLV